MCYQAASYNRGQFRRSWKSVPQLVLFVQLIYENYAWSCPIRVEIFQLRVFLWQFSVAGPPYLFFHLSSQPWLAVNLSSSGTVYERFWIAHEMTVRAFSLKMFSETGSPWLRFWENQMYKASLTSSCSDKRHTIPVSVFGSASNRSPCWCQHLIQSRSLQQFLHCQVFEWLSTYLRSIRSLVFFKNIVHVQKNSIRKKALKF